MSLDLNSTWFVLRRRRSSPATPSSTGSTSGWASLHLFTRDRPGAPPLHQLPSGRSGTGTRSGWSPAAARSSPPFPHVYATVFSGFYLALILLLFALIFRAVAIEFRSKQPMLWWRRMWDWSFAAGSALCRPPHRRGHGQHRLGGAAGRRPRVRRELLDAAQALPAPRRGDHAWRSSPCTAPSTWS